MKKSLKLLALPFMIMTATCNVANADPVNINVTGNIVASPCTVDTAGSNLSPTLGDIQATALSEAGSASDWVAFAIELKDCPAGTTKATITFNGSADADSPASMYANAGSADNVAVELQGSGGDLFGNGKFFTGIIFADHTYTYNLKTRAYSTKGGATPGNISAAIQATFVYQ